jgi:hypothetical protein
MKSKTPRTAPASSKDALEKRRRLEELVAKQGVARTATFEHLLGAGAELWDDESDFNSFLETVKAGRHEKG